MKSGDGGAGCCSFHRENILNLVDLTAEMAARGRRYYWMRPRPEYLDWFSLRATFQGWKRSSWHGAQPPGAHGKDTPSAFRLETGNPDEDKETVIGRRDLSRIACRLSKGGDGGFGNAHKSPTNRFPRKIHQWGGQGKKYRFGSGWNSSPMQGLSVCRTLESQHFGGKILKKTKIADSSILTTLHPIRRGQDRRLWLCAGRHPWTNRRSWSEGVASSKISGHVERTAVLVRHDRHHTRKPARILSLSENELWRIWSKSEDKNEPLSSQK